MYKKSITETKLIAQNYKKYLNEIGPNLAKDICTLTKSFNEFIKKHSTTQPEKVIFVDEHQDAFSSLKIS